METWSYKDIDVYLSSYENILGDNTPTSQYWVPLSNYGLLRSRVALTPSTVEGTAISIPGRDGKTYSNFSSRGNAKISFEVLIADTWITAHKQLNMNVRLRTDYICALLNNTKRIAYKQPGREADSFFEVEKTKITLTDADEHAQTIKVEMEVYPFEFLFSGNTPITLDHTKDYTEVNNSIPYGKCFPTYVFPLGFNSGIYVAPFHGSVPGEFLLTEALTAETIVDTLHGLVYSTESTPVNMNSYFNGKFDWITLPQDYVWIVNQSNTQDVLMYSRKGIVR